MKLPIFFLFVVLTLIARGAPCDIVARFEPWTAAEAAEWKAKCDAWKAEQAAIQAEEQARAARASAETINCPPIGLFDLNSYAQAVARCNAITAEQAQRQEQAIQEQALAALAGSGNCVPAEFDPFASTIAAGAPCKSTMLPPGYESGEE